MPTDDNKQGQSQTPGVVPPVGGTTPQAPVDQNPTTPVVETPTPTPTPTVETPTAVPGANEPKPEEQPAVPGVPGSQTTA